MLENGVFAVLNIRDILPNRFQPRIYFDNVKLNELADSIKKYGIIQPIIVRKIGNKYEIISGERRYKASLIASRETIPAIVTNLNDKDAEEISLLENIQRQGLTSIEEAVLYRRILDRGYIGKEELAKKIGKSPTIIANKIRLLNLDDQVQEALLHEKISERHARSLLRLLKYSDQAMMLNRIVTERLTVKQTDEVIDDFISKNTAKSFPKVEAETLIMDNNVAKPVGKHEIKNNSLEDNERGQGFMDIDKILNEAQDINQPVQSNGPAPDLMQPNSNTVLSEPIKSETVQPEIPVQNNVDNKFVNLPGAPAPTSNVGTVDQTTTFDNVFNQTVESSESVDVVSPSVNNTSAAVLSVGPETSGVTIPQGPVNSETQPNNTAVTNSTVAPSPMPGPGVVPSFVNPVSTQPNVNPTFVSSGTSTSNVKPLQVVNPGAGEDNLTNTQHQVVPAAAPVTQPISTPDATESKNNMNIPSSDIIEENSMPSSVNQDVKVVPPSNDAHRLMQAINLIRNCSKEIENLGFYINVDEINLEDSYQVTFKINKQ